MKKKIRLVFLCAVGALCTCANAYGELNSTLFAYRIPITVSGYTGESTLENFPVLVTLEANSPSGFNYADCAVDGSDLRFADSEGNLIPHEIDTWNTAGKSLIWVGLPVLTNGVAFTMYYGAENPGPVSTANLWSLAGYAGVWHLTDGHDSTTNGLDGTLVDGITAAADAKLGGALDFNKVKMSVGMTHNGDFTNGFSLAGWCCPKSTGTKALFGKADAMSVRIEGEKIKLTTPRVKDHAAVDCDIEAEKWFHFGVTFSRTPGASALVGTGYKVYRDGVIRNAPGGGTTDIFDLTSVTNMWLGGNQWNQNFEGILDEFRLSYSIRSADWIKASYETAKNQNFVSLGSVDYVDQTTPEINEFFTSLTGEGVEVTVSVSRSLPATIFCTVGGKDYPMTTNDSVLPAKYSAIITDIPSGTYSPVLHITTTGGTEFSLSASQAFHIGALTVTKLSDADEMTLKPGVFRIARADADSAGLPPLTFDVNFAGDALAAIVLPSVDSLTIPAGEAYVDISIVPTFAEDIDHDVSLVLTVSGDNISETSSAEMTVINAPYNPAIRYVATTGSDENHGGTPEFPKKSIAAAVASLDSVAQMLVCTVSVAPGTYTMPIQTDGPVTVTNAIRIIGAGETPEKVIVTRDMRASANSSAYRSYQDCSLFHLNHPDAMVANLVMNYGSAHQPNNGKTAGSAWIGASGGTISNCVVRGGRASHPYAVTPGILVLGPGLVTHCVITNNVGTSAMESSWAGTMLGNAVVLKGAGSRLENCLVRGNRSESEGGDGSDKTSTVCAGSTATIANCTIIGNRARNCGGIFANAAGVTVRNCVISGNVDVGAVADNPNCLGSGTFLACATDDATAINENCFTGTAASFFKDYDSGDYTPKAGGPLVGKGVDYEGMAAVDLAGKPRKVGKRIDIGCYEAHSSALIIIVR